ncbi:MAG: hypothetical protein KA715_00895 [Xanthomonadaceae bacterium]|nr:hypothetical protein [Xanthomonadaceae bacterium]
MIAILLISLSSFGAGKKPVASPPIPLRGKKIIEITEPQSVEIELPDYQIKDFGQDYYLRLVSGLIKTDQFVVLNQIAEKQTGDTDEFVWNGPVIPSAQMQVGLKAMSFVTGSRGSRMFYGFDEKNEKLGIKNDFPVKLNTQAYQYFYESFAPRGDTETGSLSGLDLGEGISLDVIFAFLKVKYATYRTRMKLDLTFASPSRGEAINRTLDIKAKGYFYDVVGGYLGYYGGLSVARRDAWLKIFNELVTQSQIEITKMLDSMPLTGMLNEIVNTSRGTRYLVGTGLHSQIQKGVQYTNSDLSHVFEVEKSVSSGVICILKSGDPKSVQRNMLLSEWSPEALSQVASLAQMQKTANAEVNLPDQNIPKTKLGDPSLDNEDRPSLWTLVKRFFTLPYRILRYFEYDQKLKSKQTIYNGEPLVAVIDTGLNYNKKQLENHLWISPLKNDSRYGWDFISGDSRPFDDHYHGTDVSLAALSQMQNGKIMAIKAFNPWGVTSSDHLVRSMKFAISNGARVVLTAWKTFVDAEALKEMEKLAFENGVTWIRPGEKESDHDAAIRAGIAAQSLAE